MDQLIDFSSACSLTKVSTSTEPTTTTATEASDTTATADASTTSASSTSGPSFLACVCGFASQGAFGYSEEPEVLCKSAGQNEYPSRHHSLEENPRTHSGALKKTLPVLWQQTRPCLTGTVNRDSKSLEEPAGPPPDFLRQFGLNSCCCVPFWEVLSRQGGNICPVTRAEL